MRLDGKVALVTDVGSENGSAVAHRFASEGAHVAVCRGAGIRSAPIPADLPPEMLQLEGDICSSSEAQRMMAAIEERFARLDALVNHGAGGRIVGTVMDISEADFHEAMASDALSVMMLSAAAIPLMQRSGGGAIVNIASIGRRGLSRRPLRSASQAAVSALTACMAIDHAADGIRVNGLLLGPTGTKSMPPEQREQLARKAPLGELAAPEDIAAAALFLASDEARLITGALLPLDAGRSLPTL